MPGTAHEVLLVALREQPALLGALVAKLTGASLPRGLKPVDSAVRFVKTAEVRPDILFLKRRKRWVLVELQGRCDPAKRRRWLLAAGVLLNQTGQLGDVLVITARREVARWALRVAHLRTQLGTRLSLTPVVLHLGETDAEALLDDRHPELSLFAAWAMQNRHGPKAKLIVERALELTWRLGAPLRNAQSRAILSVLSKRMLALFRKASMNPDKIPETPAARKTRLFLEAQGRKRGQIEGEAKGRAEGLTKGEVKGKQDALLALLKARGLSVSTEQRAALRACTDSEKLNHWIVKAATAASASDVLGPTTQGAAPRAPRRRSTNTTNTTARSRAARRP